MLETLKSRGAVTAAPPRRGVRLSEIRDVGKIDLRGDPGERAFMGAVGRTLDLLLPSEPCQSATQAEITALWVGPDQWLITCPNDRLGETVAKLDEATRAVHAAVADVSAGRTVFRLAGPSALDVVAKGCPLDLHPRVARPGLVAGSVFAKITALIHLREADVVDLYLGRSFADYLWAWLEEAG
ncbi:MAG: sarcosine oxidase subunit gamma, partial [Alphaproteobacteria bacterium]|nr:sarcosine oxidase subunit gamma [Alphaproteobacteria bacterium]